MFILQRPHGRGSMGIRGKKVCWVEEESPLDLLRPSPPVLTCCLLPGPPPSSSSSSSSSGTSTMESSAMLLFVGLLSVLCHGQVSQEVSTEDFEEEKAESAADRDLIEALETLVGRMYNRVSSTEKRGSIPLCGMGDRCAMKFGPRIGKLCDCNRGANCNSYLLKCI